MSLHSIAQTCFFVAPKEGSRKRKRRDVKHPVSAEALQESLASIQQDVSVRDLSATSFPCTHAV